MSDAPALAVAALEVAYGPVTAVRGISLTVGPGEAVAVIGSNGAGKTSMLRGIMGLVRASGRVTAFGEEIRSLPTHAISRRGIGYVPEGRMLFAGLTVDEELLIGSRFLSRSERVRKLAEIFTLFPRLSERRSQITRTMSGGEQQMLAIARILMGKPRLLLLDEPSLGLAPVIQDAVYETLGRLRRAGLPMLLVEQNAYRALNLCERAYVIELGQVTREDAAVALLDDPSIRAAYLGG
jgi:branched-chain amino acid transport system ATP-binding protein